ncbi:MAG TPA: hypothetical protein VFQ05_09995 [Candidatus Eisenbacteria bacterium]|nr:hypothetical protein [Candidatus Eisenbacteria bacterium]
MWIDSDLYDLAGMMLLGGAWVTACGGVLAGFARHLLIQRRIERTYRLRLARWRATVDTA